MNWLADQTFILLSDLFERFGVPIVFVAALSEATVGLGLIVPGVLLIFIAGVYAEETGASFPLMLAVATVGTIIGDTLSYGLGRWGGKWLEGSRFESGLRMGAVLVQGRAKWFIPFYHFHNVTRTFGPFGAGALRMPLRIWMPLDYLGAFIANAAWMGAGVILGRAVMNDDGTLNEHPALRIGFMVASTLFALVVYSEWLKNQRKQREAEEAGRERLLVTVDGGEESSSRGPDEG